MAGDRVLRVVLVGNSKSAVRAIGATEAATGSLGSKLTSVAGRFKSVGKSLTSAGRSITHTVTLPVVAAGAAAIKMSTDFNSAMTRVQTQAGASAKDVQWLSKRVLDLSGKTQQSPLELANSMYHLKSVGMGNVEAMKALRSATKLASVGNADMESTTNALAGAWRVGIPGAKTFHDTIATVNAVIGAGNMTLGDFNDALGTGFLPSAKAFGLSLGQVGAALALFTDEGVPANVAATRLRMSFSLLGAPSKAAVKALDSAGISAEKMSNKLQNHGLIGAIGYLKDGMKGLSQFDQKELLTRAFGGGRSSSAILSMINNFDVLKQKQDQVTESTGKFGAAVRKQAKTPQAQFKLLLSTIEMLAIKIGNVLLPFAVKAAQAFNRFLGWVSKLSPQMKHFAGMFLLIVAAAGPLLSIIGSIALGIGALATPVGLIIAAIIGLAAAFAYAYTHSKKFRQEVDSAFSRIKPQFEELVGIIQTRFIPAWKKILPILKPIVAFLGGMFVDALVGAISGAIQTIEGLVQVISGVVNLVDDLIHGRWSQIWGDLWSIIKGALNVVIGGFKVWWNVGILSIFKHGIFGILKLTKGGWKRLIGDAEGFIGKIGSVLKGIVNLYTWPYRQAFKLTESIVKTGWRYIRGDFTGGIGSLKAVLGRVVEVVTYPYRQAFSIAKNVVRIGISAVVGIVRAGPSRIVGVLKSLPGRIKGVFSGAFSWLGNAGRDLIQGFVAGITSKFDDVKNTLGDLTSKLTSWKGPPEKDRKLLTPAGQMIMDGFRRGLENRFPGLRKLLLQFSDHLPDDFAGKDVQQKVNKSVDTLMNQVEARVNKTKSRLSNLMNAKGGIVSSITGMKTSIFGNAQDDNGKTSTAQILTFAKAQETHARRLKRAMREVTKMGLSKSLVRQFADNGDAGFAQLMALAHGPKRVVQQLNAIDSRTSHLYGQAGNKAGNYLYGKQIHTTKHELHVEVKVASMIGEKDFAKKITPVIRDELASIGKRNGGRVFGGAVTS